MEDPVTIVGYTRTPIGAFQGKLSAYPAPKLGAIAIEGLIKKVGCPIDNIDAVIMGCVLSAGLGQAPARQAALNANLPPNIECTTVNKMCGSGMKACMLGIDAIYAGSADVVVAGGMENMSLAPYLLPKARKGYRMGHKQVVDHMFLDGLEDAYQPGTLMGVFADITAEKLEIPRKKQDNFALKSLLKAQAARQQGWFKPEITPVGDLTFDEIPTKAKPEKILDLEPAFSEDGTVTAANASAIADGAAALLLMRHSTAQQQNLRPIAKICQHVTYALEPEWFTTAPIKAIDHLVKKLTWNLRNVDLFEINEAFAVVTLAAINELGLSEDKVNIHGGACALGHPIGASGARIICTLLNALQKLKKRRGIAALCIGGGEATAIAVEMLGE